MRGEHHCATATAVPLALVSYVNNMFRTRSCRLRVCVLGASIAYYGLNAM